MQSLSNGQIHILQHALGLDQYGEGRAYRNQESWRVARACLAADRQQNVAKAVEYAVARERGRCLAIAGLWPDNLMAAEIAKRIRGAR